MLQAHDESTHPSPEGFDAWNESLFFDWIGGDGSQAGHCRIGVHPAQGKLWLWFYVLSDGHWACINEPALAYEGQFDEVWSYTLPSLQFRREVVAAFEANTLQVRGVGQWVDGPRAGQSVALEVQLRFDGAGPAHGMAAREIPWMDGQTYHAARYEQPCDVSGSITVGDNATPFTGMGERDHSWGPRFWEMDWTFLVLAHADLRAQCTLVNIEGMAPITVGYLQRHTQEPVQSVTFSLDYAPESNIHQPFSGTVAASSANVNIAGTIVPITGVAIDDSHCLDDEVRSIYRRNLVRFVPDDGSEPCWGWMETHRVFEIE